MLQRIQQSVIPVLILAGAIGGLLWLSSLKQPPVRVSVPYQPPLVETGSVEVHSGTFPIRIHGVVVPYREVRIAAEVDGRVVAKSVGLRSGRVVTRGTHLLTIDPEPYRLAVQQLEHEAQEVDVERRRVSLEIEQAAELVTLAEQRLAVAMRELTRLDTLKDQDALSQSVRDAAERTVLDTRSALELVQQRGEQLPLQLSGLEAKAELLATRKQQAELDLSRTEIVAPLDAIVTADEHEPGSYVETGDLLLALQDPSRFEVEGSLRADDLFWLRASSDAADDFRTAFELPEVAATVTYSAAGESFEWPGRLVRADGSGFDATTRTLSCRVIVDEPRRAGDFGPPALVVGMFVDIEFEISPRMELLALPRSALQPDGQVWVVEDGTLRVHRERPARVSSEVVLLRADRTDIKPGSRVVVSTLPMAFDGMDVRERPTP